ncbi:type II toxin-antitoxin system HicA family toxin [Intrasporangium calvum]|nr:type II toxin-antitoxin system HicA family toxin [Intrasporangium calvum]
MPVQFPSMRGRGLLAVLQRSPLSYAIVRQRGSHRHMRSEAGYPDLLFSFHDQQEIRPRVVRDILTKDVGLSEDQALEVLRG